MITQEVAMGTGILLISLYFAVRAPWFVETTKKGQWLKSRFGEDLAVHIVRGISLCLAILGLLLATGLIKPVQW